MGELRCHLTSKWPVPSWLAGKDLPTRPLTSLLDTADWGSSLESQRWVPLRPLSTLLMGQLAWEECCLRTCPGKQKTAFWTLCTHSLASLTYGTTVTHTWPGQLAESHRYFYFEMKWRLWCCDTSGENPGLLICSVSALARLTQTHASN